MSSVNPAEIAQFSKDAGHWWDENGPFAPLHRLNPVRMKYIREQICDHYGLSQTDLKPFKGLSVLDVGCGGGLACEPMARLGATVTGIDADPAAIDVAKTHAASTGLPIEYLNTASESLLVSPPRRRGSGKDKSPDARLRGHDTGLYDIVLALEIIEHVNDPQGFVDSCARLLKPGGIIIFSTLNRTPKSFALGIVAAEYVLRWVPRGTHDWRKFIRPSELTKYVRRSGLEVKTLAGLVFNPLKQEFRMSKTDLDVNYFITAIKKE